jgi:hypothetical protein
LLKSKPGLPALAGFPGRIHSAREWANEESLTIAIARIIQCHYPIHGISEQTFPVLRAQGDEIRPARE